MEGNSRWILKGYMNSTKSGRFLRMVCYNDIGKKDARVEFYVYREDVEKILTGKRRTARIFMRTS